MKSFAPALFALLTIGCVSITQHGVRVDSPSTTRRGPAQVDSVRPTLRWLDSGAPEYDVAVYLGECRDRNRQRRGSRQFSRGPQVYYRERIVGTHHMIETPLRERTPYQWTVRARWADRTSEWATYTESWYAVLSWSRESDLFNCFSTPPHD